MEHITSLIVIAQTTAIYLGVGSSTLAITSFFVSIYDGVIEPVERKMLGVIYWVLRLAMVLIAATTLILHLAFPEVLGSLVWYMWILIAVLYANATLMTLKLMPSKFGPSIQAATWYTLGFLVTIQMFDLYVVDTQLFINLYAADLLVMLASVNGYMQLLKWKQAKAKEHDDEARH
ncbi:MAG: hypothetical protein AAGA35_00220 [Patescibacteria group bacterium]